MLLGAIADDFTGATDLAGTLVNEGMRVALLIGPPDGEARIGDAQAAVVALKSRAAPKDEAVGQSLHALRWLKAKGARQVMLKYCSTFDSTPEGNIGPVCDALMDEMNVDFALACPAFPGNGRTVYQGHLFVGPQLLSDSPMRNHPLTPMRDSSLIRLMDAQSSGKAGLIPLGIVRAGEEAIRDCVNRLKAEGFSFGVADALDEGDLRALGTAAASHELLTGGSGIATGLPGNFREAGLLERREEPRFPAVAGRELALAGSCSPATMEQIEIASEAWPAAKIDLDEAASGSDVVGRLVDWAEAQSDSSPILIHASAAPAEVEAAQAKYGRERAGGMIERIMGELARRLTSCGFNRLVVAGGETSGAVVSALGVKSLRIGPEIARGVPWTEAIGGRELALALKSGNFGGPDFFREAFEALP